MSLFAHLVAAQAAPIEGDPTRGEVPLPAAGGWRARLVYEAKVGIWTTRVIDLREDHGCPEIVALDDAGRCTVLVGYSGKWTATQAVHDGAWLGALAWGDVDPHIAGRELYVGGKRGNVFRVKPHRAGGFDSNVVARFPGLELHTFVSADLSPARAGAELLAFAHSGAVFEIRPGTTPGASFVTRQVGQLSGRVRDAFVLPGRGGDAAKIVAVSRAGEVALLGLTPSGVRSELISSEPMGFGRLAVRAGSTVDDVVLYVTRDDGVVLRLARRLGGQWQRRPIYAGPQGPRGIVAGRFDADPKRETVAVFGYAAKVQLLTAPDGEGRWRAETIFVDRDKGHWLTVGELDGRNGTDEMVGCGYGGRVFQLARPPGYGIVGVATDPDDVGPQPGCVSPPVGALPAGTQSPETINPSRRRVQR